ncbi:mobilization protein MbpA [Croceitalea sp. MTPC9]|uniref:mobilization protein MbpA n=2 Tax=Croceitalea TaxID=574891 RepID=UPI0030D8AC5D
MKEALVKFRCTHKEKLLMRKKAESTGLTLSEYCRSTALRQKLFRRLTDDEVEQYKTLAMYHNNFRLLSNMFSKRNPNLSMEAKKLCATIRKHLERFRP